MHVAFRIYDADNDQSICKEEIRIVLKNIPRQASSRYGMSAGKNQDVNVSRVQLLNMKKEDNE
jgi:Ca2+-binding EF-hand superfamily protein